MSHVRTGRRWLAGFGLVATMAATAVSLAAVPAEAEGEILGASNSTAIKDSYIVEFAGGVVSAQAVPDLAATLARQHGATITHTYQHALRGFAASMSESQARKLAADPAIARVEQNAAVSLADTQPNPPSWGLDRVDQRDLPLNASYTFPNTAGNVRAYVIDTGIRITHQTFGGRAIWGVNTVDTVNTDCQGHGTHVAGTIGGAAYGVAKSVALTAVKVLDCFGGGSTATVMAGVDWVTGNHISGPAVANMSLGFPFAVPTLEQAVRNSIADGVVYAIASHNANVDACNYSPARVLEAITVNATEINDTRAAFSNFGACTDIFAPGVNITSAWSTSDVAVNTISGTSMATPHVAGAAALILSANPALNPQQVANTLYTNATPNKVPNPVGSPNRLLFVPNPPPPPPPPAADRLVRGQGLTANQFLRSQNGLYTLYMQTDGNLVLYNQIGQALWHTRTNGNPGAFAIFQGDGNFVIYTATGRVLWHTSTHGTAASLFVVQNDSNVVIYGPQFQVFWHRLR